MDIFEDDSEEMMLRLVEMVDLEKTMDPTEEDQNCTHNSGEAHLSDDDLDKFFEKGRGCKKGKDNKPCCTLFKKEDYLIPFIQVASDFIHTHTHTHRLYYLPRTSNIDEHCTSASSSERQFVMALGCISSICIRKIHLNITAYN